jgi:lipoprotein-releasing system permease protein
MAGFESFVAWRYLMARQRRISKLALIILLIGLFIGAGAVGAHKGALSGGNPLKLTLQGMVQWAAVLDIVKYVGFGLAGLALFFGVLRLFFTFFTVVPLGGVWIGTGALVCVLSVMSGFESDLRQKILGSNAHVQITREDGDFVEWREVKAAIDKLKGVRGSTPFASSEVVIAANNNGMNVVIKGIDPQTIGSVTDLVKNLEDREAIQRMSPLVEDELVAPPREGDDDGGTAPTADPAPEDLLEGGDPIDFSQPASQGKKSSGVAPTAPPARPSARPRDADLQQEEEGDGESLPVTRPAASKPAPGSALIDIEPAARYGGDAVAVVDEAGEAGEAETAKPASGAKRQASSGTDPLPDDFADSSGEPIDFSISAPPLPRVTRDGEAHVLTVPMNDGPRGSRRTLSLPGVLVGRELVKQTHMYTGQEVRVVSPLSDPANPDATGTPIPFNRDYRVAGIFYTGMYEYDLKQVYVTLDSFQEFLDRGDAVDGIEVRVESPDDAAAYVKRISAVVGPAYRVVDWTELNRSLFSALKLEKITMFIVLGIVILVASFSIVGNLIMVVFEKGREIALLKTLGATNWGVMWLFVLRGLMIGMIGTLLGVGMGLSACLLAKRFGIPLNPDVYYIDRLPIHIDSSSVALIAFAGVAISGLAALYPALLAIRIRPANGLRH